MRVLYLCHTSEISGAERTLIDLLDRLAPDVSPVVACPAGPLADRLQARQVAVRRIPEIRGSLRTHVRHTTGAIATGCRAALEVRRIAKQEHADLVDANSIRAGLAAGLAWRLGGPPSIVHIDDCLPSTRAGRLARLLIGRWARMLLPNSRYTAAAFAPRGCRATIRVLYNTVDLARFADPAADGEAAERHSNDEGPILGVVAQLTPWKGQDDAIRMLAELRASRPRARLRLAGEAKFTSGSARYDNATYRARLRDLAAALAVSDAVEFLGEREDVPQILRGLDYLLLPSWEEPFGKVVLEAMAMGVPVIATNVGGPAEIIRDAVDGLLLPPRQPTVWAAAIERLIRQPELAQKLGREGRRRVETSFSAAAYLKAEVDAYHETLRAAG